MRNIIERFDNICKKADAVNRQLKLTGNSSGYGPRFQKMMSKKQFIVISTILPSTLIPMQSQIYYLVRNDIKLVYLNDILWCARQHVEQK